MSAIWESANWTRQFGIRQTGNRQFGMLPIFIDHFLTMIFAFYIVNISCLNTIFHMSFITSHDKQTE